MKKVLILILALFTVNVFASCDRPVTFSDLPSKAQQFINQHFNGIEVISVVADDGHYEVYLSDGTELEFDRKGEWRDVDCKRKAVPAAIIPTNITNYVKSKFPSNFIVRIEKKHVGYEVELDNDLDLRFDKNGNFQNVD